MEELINIDKIADVPRERIHQLVAEVIAEENLDNVNEHSSLPKPVVSFYTEHGKRIADVLISLVALIITIPVNLIIGLCTFVTLGNPIFFQEKRVGKDGKLFVITKFRNMTNERDANGDLLPPNKRVTKFGKFVRKTSLDELLNFWSILKGDMSLIGPRPLQPVYMNRYSERHKMRNAVRPGLECPMIVCGDHNPSWSEQFENDIYYVEHISLMLDMKQCISLGRMVFNKKLRERSAFGIRGGFMGYTLNGDSINAVATPKRYVEKAIKKYKEQNLSDK